MTTVMQNKHKEMNQSQWRPELDAGHFFWTRPDTAQLFYAVPKSKNCNTILID